VGRLSGRRTVGVQTVLRPWRGQPVWVLTWLLLTASVAWAVTVMLAHGMGDMPANMGLALLPFVGVWITMMAAMMLPAVAPVATLYMRTITTRRPVRVATFLAGYLLVWAASGVPAFALVEGASWLAGHHAAAARVAAVAAFIGIAAYQVSRLKGVCLRHCRSPLATLLRYASATGRLRDLRVGAHHGLYCLGCCWALFLALIVLGVMNLLVMVGLAVVVTLEKLSPRGVAVSRLAALASLGLALAVALRPDLAQGLWMQPMNAGM